MSVCVFVCLSVWAATAAEINESTTGADASVEALKLYHMKLTLAYSSLHASDSSLPEYKKWEMIALIVAKNPQMGVPVCNDCC